MNNSHNNKNLNKNLLGFVPAIVVENFLNNDQKKQVFPRKQTIKTVAMFSDVSGFTNLSEKLSTRGKEGQELLGSVLNRYMELLVKAIGKSGGDIFKFAGDALIALWPPDREESYQGIKIRIRQALQSVLEAQERLNKAVLIGDIELSVKMGFGVGIVNIIYVGGEFGRCEYVPVGDPLIQAFESEHHAQGGGEVIVSKQVWAYVHDCFIGVQLEDKDKEHATNSPFTLVKEIKKGYSVKMKADAQLIYRQIKDDQIELIQDDLMKYVPRAVLPYIKINQESWSSELRWMTTLFVSLGIDLVTAKTEKGMQLIQKVILTVQRCIYQSQGSLNKFIMDDKGSTLIAVFGLPPMAHEDDSVRGVIAAIQLCKELKKINCDCSCGITTGRVLGGVVGTSGSRREYSILGDKVNLAARLMGEAKQSETKKILVGPSLVSYAQQKMSFRFVGEKKFKGKDIATSYYEPIMSKQVPTPLVSFPNLKTHLYNIMDGKNEESYVKQSQFLVGQTENHEEMKYFIEEFIKRPDYNRFLLLTGERGQGKTLIIRDIMIKLKEEYKQAEKFPLICVSMITPLLKIYKFSGWRCLLVTVFETIQQNLEFNKINTLNQILQNQETLLENQHLVYDILDIENTKFTKKKEQYIPIFNEVVKSEIKEILIDIFIQIILYYLDIELNESSLQSPRSEVSFETTPRSHMTETNQKTMDKSIIFIQDDMQSLDLSSFEFLSKLFQSLNRGILYIGILRVDSMYDSYFQADPNGNIEKGMNFIDEIEDYIEEGQFLRCSAVPQTTQELKDLLFFQFKVSFIHSDIVLHIKEKTMGNPLESIQYMESLINEKAVEFKKIKNKKGKKVKSIQPTQLFIKCQQLDDYLQLGTPSSKICNNGHIVDKLECQEYLLMKLACVIGEQFDYQTLVFINPFQEAGINSQKILTILQNLESRDFLEILHETAHNKIYRFTMNFVRNLLYDIMTFKQRRSVHRLIASSFQDVPQGILATINNSNIQAKSLLQHHIMSEETELQLVRTPFFEKLTKRTIAITKMHDKLTGKGISGSASILKQGWLFKQSDGGMVSKFTKNVKKSWQKRWCVLTSKDLKYYYNRNDSSNAPLQYLGLIYLNKIYKLEMITDKKINKPVKNMISFLLTMGVDRKQKFDRESNCIIISTGSWNKKQKEKSLAREFCFSTEQIIDLEEWITVFQFGRAKAIYDEFSKICGKVQFPLSQQQGPSKFSISSNENKGKSRTDPFRANTQNSRRQSKQLSRKNTMMGSVRFRKATQSGASLLKRMSVETNLHRQMTIELKEKHSNAIKLISKQLRFFLFRSMLLFWMNIIIIPTKNIMDQYSGLGGVQKFFKQRAHLLMVPGELKKAIPMQLILKKTESDNFDSPSKLVQKQKQIKEKKKQSLAAPVKTRERRISFRGQSLGIGQSLKKAKQNIQNRRTGSFGMDQINLLNQLKNPQKQQQNPNFKPKVVIHEVEQNDELTSQTTSQNTPKDILRKKGKLSMEILTNPFNITKNNLVYSSPRLPSPDLKQEMFQSAKKIKESQQLVKDDQCRDDRRFTFSNVQIEKQITNPNIGVQMIERTSNTSSSSYNEGNIDVIEEERKEEMVEDVKLGGLNLKLSQQDDFILEKAQINPFDKNLTVTQESIMTNSIHQKPSLLKKQKSFTKIQRSNRIFTKSTSIKAEQAKKNDFMAGLQQLQKAQELQNSQNFQLLQGILEQLKQNSELKESNRISSQEKIQSVQSEEEVQSIISENEIVRKKPKKSTVKFKFTKENEQMDGLIIKSQNNNFSSQFEEEEIFIKSQKKELVTKAEKIEKILEENKESKEISVKKKSANLYKHFSKLFQTAEENGLIETPQEEEKYQDVKQTVSQEFQEFDESKLNVSNVSTSKQILMQAMHNQVLGALTKKPEEKKTPSSNTFNYIIYPLKDYQYGFTNKDALTQISSPQFTIPKGEFLIIRARDHEKGLLKCLQQGRVIFLKDIDVDLAGHTNSLNQEALEKSFKTERSVVNILKQDLLNRTKKIISKRESLKSDGTSLEALLKYQPLQMQSQSQNMFIPKEQEEYLRQLPEKMRNRKLRQMNREQR